jgi:hypothetical protein
MFADFSIDGFHHKIRDQTVKDPFLVRTRQSATSAIIDCRELACRAKEEHRLSDRASPPFRGITNIVKSPLKSITIHKLLRIFAAASPPIARGTAVRTALAAESILA